MTTRQTKLTDYDGFVEKFKPKKTTDDCHTFKRKDTEFGFTFE